MSIKLGAMVIGEICDDRYSWPGDAKCPNQYQGALTAKRKRVKRAGRGNAGNWLHSEYIKRSAAEGIPAQQPSGRYAETLERAA